MKAKEMAVNTDYKAGTNDCFRIRIGSLSSAENVSSLVLGRNVLNSLCIVPS